MSHKGPLQELYGFRVAEDATRAVTQKAKYWPKLNLRFMTLLNCVITILPSSWPSCNLDKKYLLHKPHPSKTFFRDFPKIFSYFFYIFSKCSPGKKNGVPANIDLIFTGAVSL
jgi:hypothetical protein